MMCTKQAKNGKDYKRLLAKAWLLAFIIIGLQVGTMSPNVIELLILHLVHLPFCPVCISTQPNTGREIPLSPFWCIPCGQVKPCVTVSHPKIRCIRYQFGLFSSAPLQIRLDWMAVPIWISPFGVCHHFAIRETLEMSTSSTSYY